MTPKKKEKSKDNEIEEHLSDDLPMDAIEILKDGEDIDFTEIAIDDSEIVDSFIKSASERSVDSKTAIQGLVLVKMMNFIDELLKVIDNLTKEYDTIEDLLYPRLYPQELIEKNLIVPKTLIAGGDNSTLLEVKENIENTREFILFSVNELAKTKNEKIQNDLCPRCKAKIDYIEQSLGFLIDSDKTLEVIIKRAAEFMGKLRINLPISETTITNAKRLRALLTDTQAVGRQTELLFAYFLKEVLAEHGQIRRDYADIQVQTNAIYNKLFVTTGEIQLDGINLSNSLKKIMKALKNIKGDLNSLKIITVMLMRPVDHPIQVRNMLSKLLESRSGY